MWQGSLLGRGLSWFGGLAEKQVLMLGKNYPRGGMSCLLGGIDRVKENIQK